MTSTQAEPSGNSTWSEDAIAHLLDYSRCPICRNDSFERNRCARCGADLATSVATDLWQASSAAADALLARTAALDRVRATITSRTRVSSDGQSLSPGFATDDPTRGPADYSVLPSPGSPVSLAPTALDGRPDAVSAPVQSLLALAGAGLFAISAVVFTFFNADLRDGAVRLLVISLVTALFLGGASLLSRRNLASSAEIVGGLGVAFVGLTVGAIVSLMPLGSNGWSTMAVASVVAVVLFAGLAKITGLRVWMSTALVALAIVPALFGYAAETAFGMMAGHLGVAAVSLGLIFALPEIEKQFGHPLTPERHALGVGLIIGSVSALAPMFFLSAPTSGMYWLIITAAFAILTVLATLSAKIVRYPLWSFIAGAGAITTAISATFIIDLAERGLGAWFLALAPAAAVLALIVAGQTAVIPAGVRRKPAYAGALTIAALASAPAVIVGLQLVVARTFLSSVTDGAFDAEPPWTPVFVGILVSALGCEAVSRIAVTARSRELRARILSATALWLGGLAAVVLTSLPEFRPDAQIIMALALAAGIGVAVTRTHHGNSTTWLRITGTARRVPLAVTAHVALLLAVITSWSDPRIALWSGIPVLLALWSTAQTVPRRLRFLHTGAGFAYVLILTATLLQQSGATISPVLNITSSVGLIGAIAVTFVTRVRPEVWRAILIVSAVPFLIGVAQVLVERSGWTALSTALMCALGVTLVISRRRGIDVVLRAIAASLVVPAAAVTVISVGAEVLIVSASPITLPIIAALSGTALYAAHRVSIRLIHRGLSPHAARIIRVAIEISALVTGFVAAALALARVAAGLPTTFLVLLILGVGATATALWTPRRSVWWIAGASFTGALWSFWGIVGFDLLELYTVPPALALAVVGATLAARSIRGPMLYVAGLVLMVAPSLIALATIGSGGTAAPLWRAVSLLLLSWIFVGLGRGLSSRRAPLRRLTPATLLVAIAAGAAGTLQAVRFGAGLDVVDGSGTVSMGVALTLGFAGAVPALLAALVLGQRVVTHEPTDAHHPTHRFTRWLSAPAFVYVGVAAWPHINGDWPTIWTMWALMVAYLTAMVAIAVGNASMTRGYPPVWFTFGLAFVTAIAAWSPRELRVEWFSIPLGLALLAIGIRELRRKDRRDRPQPFGRFSTWPRDVRGSWSLLGPGLVVLFSASIVATFTDPQTWRAIFVIVCALIAILAGSGLRLAAPFFVGIIVLPLENIVVFSVQIGRGIASMPWWITLAVVGAVLLIIAVTSERRQGANAGITARLRDLT